MLRIRSRQVQAAGGGARVRGRRCGRLLRWVGAAGLAVGAHGAALALQVFACEPEWAALVRELAPHAQVRSATHALQDPHHIEARPSLIAQLRRADLAVCTGAALESGWLPTLQQRSGNPKVQEGAAGMFYAADHVALIDPKPPGTPFDGDVHEQGNPHVHLDPRRVLDVARALAEQLQAIDPPRRSVYRDQLGKFEASWRERTAARERRAAPVRGKRIAAQHSTYAYLWHWLGIEQIADLEPKPGLPPTPGHLQRVLTMTRPNPPKAIVVSSYQDARPARWLADQLGASTQVLQLPATVTDDAVAPDLNALFDLLVNRLVETLR